VEVTQSIDSARLERGEIIMVQLHFYNVCMKMSSLLRKIEVESFGFRLPSLSKDKGEFYTCKGKIHLPLSFIG
jgi:hypothetical protein